MKSKKIFLYGIAMLSFLGVCCIYHRLSDQIPINFGVNWEVGEYGPKYSALILGATPFLMCLLFDVLPLIDPKMKNYQKHERGYNILRMFLVLCLIGLDWMTNMMALGYSMNINTVLPLLLGLVFVGTGNYLPKMKPNYFIGIRTPWTLDNEVVWRKTHRVGGYIFVVLGIVCFLTALIHTTLMNYILVGTFVVGICWVMGYSYYCYKEEKKESKTE